MAVNMADRMGGTLYFLEHRFYGISHPFDDMATDKLEYLTPDQGLADLAWFAGSIQTNLTEKHGIPTRRVVTVGGSYPGAMSAWFRYKYPHIAFAALSSSGVVEAVADYYMYDRHTHDVLMKSGQACVDKTVQVTEYAEKLAAENPKKLFEYFNHDEMEIGEFYYFFADIAAGAVQAGQRVSFCDRLMN